MKGHKDPYMAREQMPQNRLVEGGDGSFGMGNFPRGAGNFPPRGGEMEPEFRPIAGQRNFDGYRGNFPADMKNVGPGPGPGPLPMREIQGRNLVFGL